jgi:hypothetical protein
MKKKIIEYGSSFKKGGSHNEFKRGGEQDIEGEERLIDVRHFYDFNNIKVKCDDENNPHDKIKEGVIRIDINIPHKFKEGCGIRTFKEIPRYGERRKNE